MANTIITKNSATASAVPTSGDLVQGELAVNVTDKRLFTENSGGTVVELGTNPSQLNFADNAKAIFGTGSDLQIYHDGTNSYVSDQGTGNLYIQGSSYIQLQDSDGNVFISCVDDGTGGRVQLRNEGSTKLATTSTGIDVTGTVVSDGLTVDTATTANLGTYTYTGVDRAKVEGQQVGASGGKLVFKTNTGAGLIPRMQIDHLGDISFYEDTGTTAKFFWDASAEALGIGTSTITSGVTLQVVGNTTDGTVIKLDQVGVANWKFGLAPNTDAFVINGFGGGTFPEYLRINSAGNLGLGVTPTYKLDVSAANNALLRLKNSTGVIVKTLWEDLATRQGEIALNTGDFLFSTGTGSVTEKMRLTSAGNLLVGDSSYRLSGIATAGQAIQLGSRTFIGSYPGGDTALGGLAGSNFTALYQGGTERARIDASGNLLVARTAPNTYNTAVGFEAQAIGLVNATRNGGVSLILNRLTSDGDIALFRKDGATVGGIGAFGTQLYFLGNAGANGVSVGNNFFPVNSTGGSNDNAMDCGISGSRWNDIYATNGTIQTSDANEKQDIEALSEAETRVAVACKGLLRKFRWKDAVAEKGDEARIHFGIIAQDLQAAFAAEGLDAGRYAMFISSTWTDEETGEERSRLGVRYSELLAFIIAAI